MSFLVALLELVRSMAFVLYTMLAVLVALGILTAALAVALVVVVFRACAAVRKGRK